MAIRTALRPRSVRQRLKRSDVAAAMTERLDCSRRPVFQDRAGNRRDDLNRKNRKRRVLGQYRPRAGHDIGHGRIALAACENGHGTFVIRARASVDVIVKPRSSCQHNGKNQRRSCDQGSNATFHARRYSALRSREARRNCRIRSRACTKGRGLRQRPPRVSRPISNAASRPVPPH